MEQCYLCQHFQRYYVKGTKMFSRTKIGICYKNGENVKSTYACQNFRLRAKLKYPVDAPLHQLSDILTQITEIRKYLEEKFGDAEDDK